MSELPLSGRAPRALRAPRRSVFMVAAATLCLGLAAAASDGLLRLSLAAGALSVFMVLVVDWLMATGQGKQERMARQQMRELSDLVFEPAVLVDDSGLILHANQAAAETLKADRGMVLPSVLRRHIAAPEPVIARLLDRVRRGETVAHDVQLSDQRLRLSMIGRHGTFLCRIERMKSELPEDDLLTGRIPAFVLGAAGEILECNSAMRGTFRSLPPRVDELVIDPPFRIGGIHLMRDGGAIKEVRVTEIDRRDGKPVLGLMPLSPDPQHWSTLDGLPIAVMRLTMGGKVLNANAAALHLLGRSGQCPAHFSDLVEGLGRPLGEWLLDVSKGRGVGRPEVLRARGDREDQYIQVMLRPYEAKEGGALLAVLTDATELKSLEKQFVQSQKMQAIGQLAGGVAHDFNNLLTAISGHCDLLLLNRDAGDPEYGDLMQISHNSNRAASLVGQLLAFSRTQNLQLVALDLRTTLAEIAHLLNRLVGERIRLIQRHDPALTCIRGDQRQIEQVLMNLVVNARDAMPKGGEIRVETSMTRLVQPLTHDRVTMPSGDYVTVVVEDEGTGIPADKLDRIFEPFFTTKRPGEGTGLGLSTVYGIVKQLGGYIFCDSTVGEGTKFTLYFNAHRDSKPASTALPVAKAGPLGADEGGVVLLVEDEAPVRAFAARALRLRGHVVLEAANAEDALKLLEDPALSVDIFVTDVVMPGLDGPSWVKRALKNRPETRVIFVSGYSEEAVFEQRTDVINSMFLPKPFSLAQLTEAVSRQLAA